MTYLWTPGRGPSQEALQRMRAHFGKPTQPMGEAWFMSSKRKVYAELQEVPVEKIPQELLRECLFEIASGIKCFGHRDEWDEWFKYLPQL